MARSDKTPAFWSLSCPHRQRFRLFVKTIKTLYNVDVRLPTFRGSADEREKSFKRFCSAPLERLDHPWDIELHKLGKRSRFSVWMSLFLFRKTLPSKASDLSSFMDGISSESEEPDPVFMSFVRSEVPKMFPVGWDTGYLDKVSSAVASTKACAEIKRSAGGARMWWLERYGEEARLEFVDYLLNSVSAMPSPPARLTAVETGGKTRLLSVPPASFQTLLPLHKTMYDRLTRFPWLLRGDAKPEKFKDFCRKDGEVFVSGDYESATDNLNINIQKEILRLVLQNASHVPNGVKLLAMTSLSHELSLSENGNVRTEKITKGQMMGFPISFPLLCLVNYLSFKYSTMDDKIPVKINGDDIVFRSRPSVAQRWMKDVGKSGLKLSVGKTLVDRSIFTLNSTLFAASARKVVRVPVIRSKALFGHTDGFESVSGRYGSFAPGFGQERRFLLRCLFLKVNAGFISKSCRSLNRGLQMSVPEGVLKASHFWHRECAYLELPTERPVVSRSFWEQMPQGYVIAHAEKPPELTKEEKYQLTQAIVESAWIKPDTEIKDYISTEYTGSVRYNGFGKSIAKKCRLLGISRQNFIRRVNKGNATVYARYVSSRIKLRPYWMKVGPRPTRFVREGCNEIIEGSVDLSGRITSSADDEEDIDQEIHTRLGIGCLADVRYGSEGRGDWYSRPRDEVLLDDEEVPYHLRSLNIKNGRGEPASASEIHYWRCSGEDRMGEKYPWKTFRPGIKVAVMDGGIGIGPPTCF
jgi:hypothetical protein